MPTTFIDTHCHLTDEPLFSRLPQVVDRARQQLVTEIVVPAYDLPSSFAAARLAAAHEDISFGVGIHPGWLENKTFPESALRDAVIELKPAAIGEVGLDYALDHFDPELQDQALERQLELAEDFNLPVIIHCRKAVQPLYDRLKHFPGVTGVLHAFNGGPDFAEKFLELGYFLAFGGGVTRPNARKIRKTALMVPADRVVLETDAPYIGSHTVPKSEMEPAVIPLIARAFAELRGWTLEEAACRTTDNARRLFKLPAMKKTGENE